eukprot:6593696-Pyramimonas_sp.AAC.1
MKKPSAALPRSAAAGGGAPDPPPEPEPVISNTADSSPAGMLFEPSMFEQIQDIIFASQGWIE